MRRDKTSYLGFKQKLSLIPEQTFQIDSAQQQLFKFDSQEKMYHKIRNFISRSNQKQKKKQKLQKSVIKSHRVLVHSQQQRQLMSSLGPGILPILVSSRSAHNKTDTQPKVKNKSKKKQIYKSTLQNIFQNQQKFMKTYFAEIKEYKKNENSQQQISYTFPQVCTDIWKINGYIKGKHVLIKGTNRKNRTVIKKYQYSDVYKKIRRNYQQWVKDIFIIQGQTAI